MNNDDKSFRGIPIIQSETVAGPVKSGQKYQTDVGFSAVKNGVKQRRETAV